MSIKVEAGAEGVLSSAVVWVQLEAAGGADLLLKICLLSASELHQSRENVSADGRSSADRPTSRAGLDSAKPCAALVSLPPSRPLIPAVSLCLSVFPDHFRGDVLPAEQHAAPDLPCLLNADAHLQALMARRSSHPVLPQVLSNCFTAAAERHQLILSMLRSMGHSVRSMDIKCRHLNVFR